MKKQLLLFAVVALSTALLVGCKKKDQNDPENPAGQSTLTLSPRNLVLVLGDSPVGLTATLSPAVAGATIEWSSSNSSVASVTNRGYVQAVDYGDCYVYAKYGDLKDSCFIHVQTYMEGVIFNSAFLSDLDTAYYADSETGEIPIREITASDGSTFKCYISQATMMVFSDGFYVNNSYELDGSKQGVILEMSAPMFYGTKYLNPGGGVLFSLGEWVITDTAGSYIMHTLPGELDEVEYIAQQKHAIEAINADNSEYVNYWKAASNAFEGPTLNGYEYMNFEDGTSGYGSSYVPEAICKSARFFVNEGFQASEVMYKLDYSEVQFLQLAQDTVLEMNMGLNLGYDAEKNQIFFNDEKVHYNPLAKSVYGNVPASEDSAAPRLKQINVPASVTNPAIAAKVREQIKNNSNVVLIRIH